MRRPNKIPFFRIAKSQYSLHIFLLGSVVGFIAAYISQEELHKNSSLLSSKSVARAEEKKEATLFSQPAYSPILERVGYTLSYDGKNRIPKWVYEHLTDQKLKGEAESHRYRYQEDDALPKHLRSTEDDYVGTSYKKSPLCPPNDQKISSKAMYDTFYLSNAVPRLEGKALPQLERQIRFWTKKFKDLHVVTGPLFLPTVGEDGKKYVHYEVFGPHNVAVPTHFYKVILAEKKSGELELCAFLIPNKEVDVDLSLRSYLVSVEEIEKESGLEFFKEHSFPKELKSQKPTSIW